jgi:hypothetical protein
MPRQDKRDTQSDAAEAAVIQEIATTALIRIRSHRP